MEWRALQRVNLQSIFKGLGLFFLTEEGATGMGGIQFCLTTGILSKLRRSERACYLLAPDICCRDMISSIKKPGHQSVLIQLHPRAGLWRPGSLHSPDCTRHQHLQPRLASPLPGKAKQSKSPQQDPLAHLFSDLLAAPLTLVLSSPSTLLLSFDLSCTSQKKLA